jgi:aminomethyltransferase
MCYPLYGQDITLQTNPIEADLGHFIRTDHDFIGRQAVEQIQRQGVVRKLIAFVSESRARPEKGSTILVSAAPVGTVTSGSFSPSLGTSIGMGYVHISAASESGRLLIDTGKRTLEAVIQSKPLYKRGTCRAQNVGPETTHGS